MLSDTSVPSSSRNLALTVSSLGFGGLKRIRHPDLAWDFPLLDFDFEFEFKFELAFDEFF